MVSKKIKATIKAWMKAYLPDKIYTYIISMYNNYHDFNEFYPREMYINKFTIWYKTFFGIWERLSFERSMIQRTFYVFFKNSAAGKVVVKIPRGDNAISCRLIYALRNKKDFNKYKQLLFNLQEDKFMQRHFVNVLNVRRDGGYNSEFVEGYNMAHLRDRLFDSEVFPQNLRKELIIAINQLIHDLRGYQAEHGQLIGDWTLHNMLYSSDRAAIINVDAEGFFTYDEPSVETNLPLVERFLKEIVKYLKLLDSRSLEDRKTLNVLRILDEVRLSGESYSGENFIVGYHTLELNGKTFRGQRNCLERFKKIPFNFKGKVVVDLGCNTGGMLHALSKTIKQGYGFDFNPKCVNAAQSVKKLNRIKNLEFFNIDLDRDDLSLLPCLVNDKIDICFLLSVCMWLQRWKVVVHHTAMLADALLFESNGTVEQQNDQEALLHVHFERVSMLSDASLDDPLQSARKLFLCTGSRVLFN